jgi:hypothetical protein
MISFSTMLARIRSPRVLFTALLAIVAVFFIVAVGKPAAFAVLSAPNPAPHMFAVQAIDTMKDSRDRARAALYNPSFTTEIDAEMTLIKAAGATHVAIGTPYDKEFYPILAEWVASARAHGLSVWFRGNFSGWEGWFGYAKITPAQHQQMLTAFIQDRAPLFQDGDLFSPCPECENGGAGDPRQTGSIASFHDFLVAEDSAAQNAFAGIGKKVTITTSMNADIAKALVSYEASTTGAARVPIAIDNYTAATTTFARDVQVLAGANGAIAIGEFGSPIPDINGWQSEDQQATFIEDLLQSLYYATGSVSAVNYWTLHDSSTALVNQDHSTRAAYDTVQTYYTAPSLYGMVTDEIGTPLSGIPIYVDGRAYATTTQGAYQVFLPNAATITFGGGEYRAMTLTTDRPATTTERNVVLVPSNPNPLYKIQLFLSSL